MFLGVCLGRIKPPSDPLAGFSGNGSKRGSDPLCSGPQRPFSFLTVSCRHLKFSLMPLMTFYLSISLNYLLQNQKGIKNRSHVLGFTGLELINGAADNDAFYLSASSNSFMQNSAQSGTFIC